jgi:Holliday junction DNA helicase RuvB
MKDDKIEVSLRPQRLQDYVGQDHIKEILMTAMEAANERGDPLDHILLTGGPGLGKTTLANIIANEMQTPIHIYMGTLLKSPKDIYSTAFKIQVAEKGIIFIDEIHRTWIPIQELLYPMLEDGLLVYKIGSSSTTIKLPPFTLIGATTIPHMLSQPFRDRFPLKFELKPYNDDQLAVVTRVAAKKLGIVDMDDDAIRAVVARARRTPRVAINLLRRIRDYAEVQNVPAIDGEFAQSVLNLKGLVAVSE